MTIWRKLGILYCLLWGMSAFAQSPAASPTTSCSVSPNSTICKESTYSLTQPSIHFAASAAASRSMHANASVACTFSPSSTICRERTFFITQPSATVTPSISIKRALHANASVSFALGTVATHIGGTKSALGPISVSLSTAATVQRAMHVNVAVGLGLLTVGGRAGTNRPANLSASCALNPGATICREQTQTFTQPSVNFGATATGTKTGASSHNYPVNVAATFTLTPTVCRERGVTFNSQTLQLSPAAGVCLTRNFPAETVTFGVNATVTRIGGKSLPVSVQFFANATTKRNMHGNVTTAFQLTPVVGINRGMHAAVSAALYEVAVVSRLRAIQGPMAANPHLVANAAGVKGITKNVVVSGSISPAATRVLGKTSPIISSTAISPIVTTQRSMHANPVVGLHFSPAATGLTVAGKMASASAGINVFASAMEVRAMHSTFAASGHFDVNATGLRAAMRNPIISEQVSPSAMIQRATTRTLADNVHLSPQVLVATVQNGNAPGNTSFSVTPSLSAAVAKVISVSSSVNFAAAAQIQATTTIIVPTSIVLSPSPSFLRAINTPMFAGSHFSPVAAVAINRPRSPSAAIQLISNVSVIRSLNAKVNTTLNVGPIFSRTTFNAKNATEFENVTFVAGATRTLNAKRGLSQPLSIAALLKGSMGRMQPDSSAVGFGTAVTVKAGYGRNTPQLVAFSANATVAVNGATIQRRRGMIIGGM